MHDSPETVMSTEGVPIINDHVEELTDAFIVRPRRETVWRASKEDDWLGRVRLEGKASNSIPTSPLDVQPRPALRLSLVIQSKLGITEVTNPSNRSVKTRIQV